MPGTFDPYHKWLGIPHEDQPPNHYRMLGIELFESDADVIESAADQRMTHLRSFQNGKHSELSQRLLNEVSRARLCLLNSDRRDAYDSQLKIAMLGAPPALPSVVPDVPTVSAIQPPSGSVVPQIATEHDRIASGMAPRRRRGWAPLWVAGLCTAALALLVVAIIVISGALGGGATSPPNDDEPVLSERESDPENERETGDPDGVSPDSDSSENGQDGSDNPPDQDDSNNDAGSNTADNGTGNGSTADGTDSGGDPMHDSGNGDQGGNTDNAGDPTGDPDGSEVVNPDDPNDNLGEDGRRLVPVASVLDPLMDRIRTSYALDNNRTPEETSQLARRMLDASRLESGDPDEQYALLDQAIALAESNGDLQIMWECVSELSERYDIDAVAVKADALATCAPQLRSEDEVGQLIAFGYDVIGDAVRADRVDLAAGLVDALVSVSQRSIGRAFQKEIAELRRQLNEVEEIWLDYQGVAGAVAQGAADPSGLLIAGQWHCFWMQDWERGLPLLADGADEELAALANSELNHRLDTGPNLLAMADAWWDAAQSAGRESRADYLHRSGRWYVRALEKTESVIDLERIHQRLRTIDQAGVFPVLQIPLARFGGRLVRQVELEEWDLIDDPPRTVRAMAFSADGLTLAMADVSTVYLYDLKTGQKIGELDGHRGMLTVAFSPDQTLLATGGSDHEIRVWDLATGMEMGQMSGHQQSVTSLIFKSDSRSIISAGLDRNVFVWNRIGQPPVQGFQAHENGIREISLSSDEELLATAGLDNLVGVWMARRNRFMLTGHTAPVHTVRFSHDDNLLASGDAEGNLIVWNTRNGRRVADLTGHGRDVRQVSFFPFGNLLASVDRDGTLKIWNAAVGTELVSIERTGTSPEVVAVSPTGALIAVGGNGRAPRLWRVSYR